MSLTPLITPGLGGGALPPWTGPVRVTTYELSGSEWSDGVATYDLQLLEDLAPDYFVLIGGTSAGAVTVATCSARLTHDPFGTGDLSVSSGPRVIRLARGNGTGAWVGAITVVESGLNQDTAGFRLRDVVEVSIPALASSPQTTNVTVPNPWTTLAQVVPFGGWRGAGLSTAANIADDWPTAGATFAVSGADTLTIVRSGEVGKVEAATFTVPIIEWGSEWDVQSVSVSGTASDDGADATSGYNTGSISSVVRDSTWVWGTVRTTGCSGFSCNSADFPQGVEGVLVTLGDGVNQNASETTVAVGKEVANQRDAVVYAMEHSGLAVDYRFKADGDAGAVDLDVTVDATAGTESYDEVANPAVTAGPRLGVVTTGAQSGQTLGNRFQWGLVTWWGRHEADATLGIRRGIGSGDSVTVPAWMQSVDFSGV